MDTYQTTKNGEYTLDGTTIPNSGANRLYRRMQAEVAAGDAEILPYVEPTDSRTYRDRRQARYIAELSVEGDFQKTVGDTLDAIIKAMYGDTSELDALAAKIAAIKAEIPAE